MERKVERIRLMRSLPTRYFLARPTGVWQLILHGLAAPPAVVTRVAGWLRGGADWWRRLGATPSKDGGPMKITPWYLAALAPFAAIGCSGAYLGHAAVVMLTLGIFLRTLSLGRATPAPGPQPPTIS